MKKAAWISILLGVLLFQNCGTRNSHSVHVPDEVIQRDTFLWMLTEVQLIEGVSKQRLLRTDDQESILVSHYAELFNRFNVSEGRFLSSYSWWYQHPEEMDHLLQEAAEALTILERESVKQETLDRQR
jgi:hypothetical protein